MRFRFPRFQVLAALWMTAGIRALLANSPTPDGLAFFEQRIRPLLAEHCYECHQSTGKTKGGLALDSRAGWITGGDSGPAVLAGDPDASRLIHAVRYRDSALQMPPKQKLQARQIADLETWIQMGAPDPREGGGVSAKSSALSLEEGRQFWAFQPPQLFARAAVRNQEWPRGDVDTFILARLEAAGLPPSADADALTLVRRITQTLTGLPPTPEALETFLNAARGNPEAAWSALVDRLLASPEFGERWASHWLDVARFAESSGGGRTLLFQDAWRYRDYVIRAFNDNLPFDQFLREQIAGDLLEGGDLELQQRRLTATGFLALGPTNYEEQDKQQLRFDVIDEQLDTVGKAFLGMTLGCARCHDHKFDPIPTRDYYALAGIFASTRTLYNYTDNVARWVDRPLPLPAEQDAVIVAREQQIAATRKALGAARTELKASTEPKSATLATNSAAAKAQWTARIRELEGELKLLEQRGPRRPLSMGVLEVDEDVGDTTIRIRGNVHNEGTRVPRGFLQVASWAPAPQFPARESGRRELADWLASPQNPLTARVAVNRIWLWIFGAGLVRTPDNFGTTGEPPTHPELLDFLARRFMDQGWSIKQLVRDLVLSRTWRMSSDDHAPSRHRDPDNRLFWRMNRPRLDAEQLRDAVLTASGRLDRRVGGPNIAGAGMIDANDTAAQSVEYGYQFTDTRRSLYAPAFRNRRLELFEVFDFANINAPVSQRTVSTVAPQALYFLNHPFVLENARLAAERQVVFSDGNEAQQLAWVVRRLLGRPPTPGELHIFQGHLRSATDSQETGSSVANSRLRREAWAQIFQALFGCVDFRYLK